jgi:hypothetical protein
MLATSRNVATRSKNVTNSCWLKGSRSGGQIRDYLGRAVKVISGLADSCAAAVKQARLDPAEEYRAFFAVLERDASDSLAAIEPVLAQPAIGSPLIDNLSASIHLRALFTDLFLLIEIAKIQRAPPKPMASSG